MFWRAIHVSPPWAEPNCNFMKSPLISDLRAPKIPLSILLVDLGGWRRSWREEEKKDEKKEQNEKMKK